MLDKPSVLSEVGYYAGYGTWGTILRVNRGTDANRQKKNLTFILNAILKSFKQLFRRPKPSKLCARVE